MVGGTLVWWQSADTLPDNVCPWPAFDVDMVQDVIDNIPRCDGVRERYRVAEATEFVTRFLGEAGGAQPDTAYRTRTDSTYQSVVSRSAFVTAWRPVLWAERLTPVEPDDTFNTFTVTYRTYQGDGVRDDIDFYRGSITRWTFRFRLSESDGEPVLHRVLDQRETDIVPDQVYPEIRSLRLTKGYVLPSKRSEPTGAIRWEPDREAPAFCYTRVPLDSDHFWYRTRMGWVDSDDFRVEEDDGWRECSDVAAVRAAQLYPAMTNS